MLSHNLKFIEVLNGMEFKIDPDYRKIIIRLQIVFHLNELHRDFFNKLTIYVKIIQSYEIIKSSFNKLTPAHTLHLRYYKDNWSKCKNNFNITQSFNLTFSRIQENLKYLHISVSRSYGMLDTSSSV